MGTAEMVGGMPYIDPEDYAESMRSDYPGMSDIERLISDIEIVHADLLDEHPALWDRVEGMGLNGHASELRHAARQFLFAVDAAMTTLNEQARQEGLL